MTPEEFSSKMAAGDELLVSQKLYKRIRFHTGQGSNRDGKDLGLLADAALAQKMVDINGRYTTEDVLFAYFTDPAEAEPRVGVYLAAAKVAEPVAAVATIDSTLTTQLAALTAQEIADVVSAFTPDTPTLA